MVMMIECLDAMHAAAALSEVILPGYQTWRGGGSSRQHARAAAAGYSYFHY